MFFCSEVFDKNKGFDENFFLYFEETDYCYRSNKNNFKIYQVNSQKVYHEIGTSVETTSKEDVDKLKNLYAWHFIWSKFYFVKKREEHYKIRLNGLLSAIKGLKSIKRP